MSKGSSLSTFWCPRCGWSDFFETKTCPRCQTGTETATLSGRGKIVTFTVIRYPPEGFEKDAPYMVAIIQLDGGPRVLGRVAARIDELQIAATVEFVKNTGGSLLFKPS